VKRGLFARECRIDIDPFMIDQHLD
jgi:hypothetical protein